MLKVFWYHIQNPLTTCRSQLGQKCVSSYEQSVFGVSDLAYEIEFILLDEILFVNRNFTVVTYRSFIQ